MGVSLYGIFNFEFLIVQKIISGLRIELSCARPELRDNDNFHPPVLRPSFFGMIAGDGLLMGISDDFHSAGRYSVFCFKEPCHSSGTSTGQFPV